MRELLLECLYVLGVMLVCLLVYCFDYCRLATQRFACFGLFDFVVWLCFTVVSMIVCYLGLLLFVY